MANDTEPVGGSVQPVYARLSQAGGYHPFTADTFADWSVQAGDVVTLQKDGDNYQAPIYSSRMVWRGKTPEVSFETTGNTERESITKLAQRRYGSGGGIGGGYGGGGYRNSDLMNTRITQTEEMIELAAWDLRDMDHQYSAAFTVTAQQISAVVATADAQGSMLRQAGFQLNEYGMLIYAEDATNPTLLSTKFAVQADAIEAVVVKTGIDDLSSGETLYSRIAQTADSITAEVTRATDAENAMSSRITQTADAITAEVTRATDAEGAMSTRITQTADAITAEVTRATNAEGSMSSRITQNADAITAEVTRATTEEGSMSTRITQNASSISSEVTRATNAEGALSSRITQTENSISLVVSNGSINAASIVAAINDGSSSVTINADKIDLSGYVTATEFNTTKATVTNLITDGARVANLYAQKLNGYTAAITGSSSGGYGLTVTSGASIGGSVSIGGTLRITDGGSQYNVHMRYITMTGVATNREVFGPSTETINLTHSHSVSVASDGTVTIGNPQTSAGTFNIADTAFYQSAVSAAQMTGWNLAYSYVDPPTSTNTSYYFSFGVPSVTYDRSASYRFEVSVDENYAYIKNAVGTTVARCSNTASSLNGWNLAYSYVDPPGRNTTTAYFDFGVPSVTYDRSASYRYTISCDNALIYVKDPANTIVAELGNSAYYDAWDAATDLVAWPGSGTSSTMTVSVPSTVPGQSTSQTFTLSRDDNYAYIKNALGTTVARVSNGGSGGYNNGWAAAVAKVALPEEGTSMYMDFYYPSSTVDQQTSHRYTVSRDKDYAYVTNGSVVVARRSLNATADVSAVKNGNYFKVTAEAKIGGSVAASEDENYAVYSSAQTASGHGMGISIVITTTVGGYTYTYNTTV